jgi:DNA-binding PadR family transcriptional regulator
MSMLTPDETLLGLISIRPSHGYDLVERFRDPAELGAIWKMSTSQVYAVLKRLERDGLIIGREIGSETAPPRTEYDLTETGRMCLEKWLTEVDPSASIRRIRVEFLSRLYIARQLGLPTNPIVLRQKAACEDRRTLLRQHCDHLVPGTETLALELEIAQLDAVLGWMVQFDLISDDEET